MSYRCPCRLAPETRPDLSNPGTHITLEQLQEARRRLTTLKPPPAQADLEAFMREHFGLEPDGRGDWQLIEGWQPPLLRQESEDIPCE